MKTPFLTVAGDFGDRNIESHVRLGRKGVIFVKG